MKKVEILWKIINNYKINFVFGLPGTPVVPILSYKPNNIDWINVGNELDNGFIAQSYGFFSQKVGVLIVTTGPGIATTISSLANAVYEKNPLVLISMYDRKKDGFQNWNIVNICKSITDTDNTIIINQNDNFQTKINYAFYIAHKNNTGVCVLIEEETILEEVIYSNVKPNFEKLKKTNDVSKIVKRINKDLNNTDTVLILGHLPHLNYELLQKFLDNNNIPYVLTWKERTLISNKYYCGLIGSLGNHSANYAVYHAKNLLILGDISSNLNHNKSYKKQFSLNYSNNKDNIYSIIIDESRGLKESSKIFITYDFDYIFKHLKLNVPNDFLLKIKKSNSILNEVIIPKNDLEKYCYLSTLIYKKHNLNIPIVSGVGNHWYAIGKYFISNYPNNWLSSTTWASIGSGLFYGLGAYFAYKKPVWVFEGDGGSIFAGTTLLYLINNKHLPLTIIIFKDLQYSAIVTSFYNDKLYSNHKINEKIITTPPSVNYDILPNCHNFYNMEDYSEYLNKYPISNKLRFIIVHIKKHKSIDNNNSFVYCINTHDKNYISLMENDKLLELKNYKTTRKLDIS